MSDKQAEPASASSASASSPATPHSPLAPMLAEARAKGLWLYNKRLDSSGLSAFAWMSPDELERDIQIGIELGGPPINPDAWEVVSPAPELARRRSERVRDAAEGLLAACKDAKVSLDAAQRLIEKCNWKAENASIVLQGLLRGHILKTLEDAIAAAEPAEGGTNSP